MRDAESGGDNDSVSASFPVSMDSVEFRAESVRG